MCALHSSATISTQLLQLTKTYFPVVLNMTCAHNIHIFRASIMWLIRHCEVTYYHRRFALRRAENRLCNAGQTGPRHLLMKTPHSQQMTHDSGRHTATSCGRHGLVHNGHFNTRTYPSHRSYSGSSRPSPVLRSKPGPDNGTHHPSTKRTKLTVHEHLRITCLL